ncbi:MAG TPA: YhdP family protein [Castellaniella sp.]|nr:YhdP family protein [Castellaniella sp.]
MFVLCLYFGLGGALLAGRYLVLPHLDHWRPQIEARLSQALDARVSLGPIQASWRGWDPQFDLHDIRILDGDGRPVLSVPEVRARLNWAALLPGRQGVLRLQVRGMALEIERRADGRIELLDHVFNPDADHGPLAMPAWLRWILAQPLIAFREGAITWRDRLRGAPDLQLRDVHAVLRRQGDGLGMTLAARAPAADDTRLELRAQAKEATRLALAGPQAGWRAWLRLSGATAQDWRPWLALPPPLQQGRLDAQFWLQPGGQAPQITTLLEVRALRWTAAADESLLAPLADLWAQGGLAQWQALYGDAKPDEGLRFEARARDARLAQPRWFDEPLALGALDAQGRLRRGEHWSLILDRLDWDNADVAVRGSGRWDSGGHAGTADFQGTIARGRLDAIHRYLPRVVDADARAWLAKGLQAGTVSNGRWMLRGDLAEFPFGERPDAGDFRVEGDIRGGRVEFVPNGSSSQAWPLLRDIDGTADLRRSDLRLTASSARMEPEPGQLIRLSGVRARIPDLENDATLRVSGHTEADGAAYLSLIRHSPLSRLLHGVFDEATAAGDWQVPLALTIPLTHGEDTQVQGRIDLQQGRLQFLPHAPAFDDLNGSLHFNEHGVRIARPLETTLLGGAATLEGALENGQGEALRMQGRVTAKALAGFIGAPGMDRLSGSLAYQAQLARQGRVHRFTLDSDLRGLALDFPAPLAKPAEEPRTLQLRWSDADPQDDVLEVRLGDQATAILRHARGQRQGPYFRQVLIGLGQAADSEAPGLRLALHYPLIDLDRWNRIVDEFSIPRRGRKRAAGAASRPLWPDLSLLSVQADQLRLLSTRLDHAALRVTRTPDEHWSMNLRSDQTTGTLKWREVDGRVTGPMSARFARLSLGDEDGDTRSLLPDPEPDDEARFDDDLEIPGLVLQADNLRLYGRSMGALSVEGVRDSARHVWQLNRLRMGDDDARLRGTGTWRLRGEDRGLSLKASVEARNLGAWLKRAGLPGFMSGGQGTLQGDFFWRNLPWRRDKADLRGTLQVQLDKGRFLKLGSQTAKLLEVLSLQSITRLNRLEQGLTGLPKDGYPFDQLRGSLALDRGVLRGHDYKIIGPVGTALIEGSTNILDQTLDLQAVLVPNLDVSGAALAAGIAINPVVGLGAFLTQWLLKAPLAKAMTVRYHVTGTWDDPVIKEIPVDDAPQPDSKPGPKP